MLAQICIALGLFLWKIGIYQTKRYTLFMGFCCCKTLPNPTAEVERETARKTEF